MISDAQNYKNIIESTFGAGSATFDANLNETNDVIGALNHVQFDEFKKNFTDRLRRLVELVDTYPHTKSFVLKAVNEIVSSRNWDGAYAELATLDFFIKGASVKPSWIELDKESSASETIAHTMGMSNVDHDIYLKHLKTYIDVKVLSDKTGQIVEGIVRECKKNLSIEGLRIQPFFNIDTSYREVESNRSKILSELDNAFAGNAKPERIKSSVVSGLEFVPIWSSGVYCGESTYNPQKHAQRHFPLLFQHAKKFHLTRPSVICFVHFPWFGEKVPPLGNANVSFYKALCEEFFEKSDLHGEKASKYNRKIKGNITASEVASRLSGVLFLDDRCILGGCEAPYVDSYFYMNRRHISLVKTLRLRYFLAGKAKNLRSLNSYSKWSTWRKMLLRFLPI